MDEPQAADGQHGDPPVGHQLERDGLDLAGHLQGPVVGRRVAHLLHQLQHLALGLRVVGRDGDLEAGE